MLRRRDVLAGAAALAGCSSVTVSAPPGFAGARPLVIAHRGASGERPEHTMAAYRRAIERGCDFIEPDLVMTKDGHFICRHENELSGTTDVADRREFRDRRVVKLIDGVETIGWFSEDFTLAEIRTLLTRERIPELRPANTQYDRQEPIPTFQEVFELARDESERTGRIIGLYPELKHPTHFHTRGLAMPDAMARFLRENNLDRANAPVFVQCFEEQALRALRIQGVRTRLVFLMSADGGPYDQVVARRARAYREYLEGDLAALHEFADALGLEKTLIIPRDENGASLPPTDVVRRATAARLPVHAWTFRAENAFLPVELRRGDPDAPDYARQHGDLAAEILAFARLGVEGVFTDHPGEARRALSGALA
ncbi:MAG: glycerophosphodiester phosphodiesterase [Hydrogenophilaceae bacterium]|jgi:glycerophosphoryl diester phosphodiesterase|nr:glycerophosphodiester phosphodiesterase [Hydrogenophilaceae bacterium]